MGALVERGYMEADEPEAAPFTWASLGLPHYEDTKDTDARLDRLVREHLKENNIPTKVEKGSPGLRVDANQAREVAVMSTLGLNLSEIALVLNVEEKAVKFFYGRELNTCSHYANMAVAKKALEMATSGKYPDMTKFWLKSRAGWKEAKEDNAAAGTNPSEIGSARDKLATALGVSLASKT